MIVTGTLLRNHYQIIKLLGRGGFGHTYLAIDLHIPKHSECVVKHLKPDSSDPIFLQQAQVYFNKEAKILADLGRQSECIPRLLAHFEERGEFYLVQEYIDGQDLHQEIGGNRLSEGAVREILQGILSALEIVHKNNVIHRDIKPANIMRRRDGRIVLIDFGAVKEISNLLQPQHTQSTVSKVIGTAGYMPSEQARGRPKLASDIYAVGMIGIQALTGIQPQSLPEDAETGEVIWRNQAQVSGELADVLDKMVSDHFTNRYPDATAALKALKCLRFPISSNSFFLAGVQQNFLQQKNIATSPPPDILSTGNESNAVAVLVENTNITKENSSVFSPDLDFVEPLKIADLWNIKSLTTVPQKPLTKPEIPLFNFTTVRVNEQGGIIHRQPQEAEFFREYLPGGICLEMVAIKGGSFMMGSPETEMKREGNETPQHLVNIKPFSLGKYAITQAQWQAVMGNNPSYFKGAQRPVETVSWHDAILFCSKISQLTGKKYRLPSEAEWEYACRAGATTQFYFGENITPELVNYDGNYPYSLAVKGKYREQTTEVGSFPPNAFGLYDMHGNVWEWCQDIWHEDYTGAPIDGSAWEVGGDHNYRLKRGGSWHDEAALSRCASRFCYQPAICRWWNDGFRVAIDSF